MFTVPHGVKSHTVVFSNWKVRFVLRQTNTKTAWGLDLLLTLYNPSCSETSESRRLLLKRNNHCITNECFKALCQCFRSISCVITQKSAVLSYIATEAWNHASYEHWSDEIMVNYRHLNMKNYLHVSPINPYSGMSPYMVQFILQ